MSDVIYFNSASLVLFQFWWLRQFVSIFIYRFYSIYICLFVCCVRVFSYWCIWGGGQVHACIRVFVVVVVVVVVVVFLCIGIR